MIRIAALIVATSFSFAALAQDGAKKACCQKGSEASAGCCQKGGAAAKSGGCGSAAASACADMPRVTFVVGDKTACCPKEAEKLANGDSKLIRYRVGDKTYENRGDAQAALAEALEAYLGRVTTVAYVVGEETMHCPVGAADAAKKAGQPVKFRVASYTFADKAKADKAAADAKAAADKVAMTTVVGSETYGCPMSAKAAADANGKKVEYAVGESRTCCPVEAKATLAQARVEAALKVLAAEAGA